MNKIIVLCLINIFALTAFADTPDRDVVIARLVEKYQEASVAKNPNLMVGIYDCKVFWAEPGVAQNSSATVVVELSAFDGGLRYEELHRSNWVNLDYKSVEYSSVMVDTKLGAVMSYEELSSNKTSYMKNMYAKQMTQDSLIMQVTSVLGTNPDSKELQNSIKFNNRRVKAINAHLKTEKLSQFLLCHRF